jgi:hypothetical protein
MGKGGYSKKEVGSPEQKCAKEENKTKKEEEKKTETMATISFRIAIFFDGTGNNKLNTSVRRIVEEEIELANNNKDQKSISNQDNKIKRELDELNKAFEYLEPKELEAKILNGKKHFLEKTKNSENSGSYLGAETNVFKMFRDLENCDVDLVPQKIEGQTKWAVFKKFYVEGIGTFSGDEDSGLWGGGLARGDSGVTMRVKQSKDRVIDFIKRTVIEFQQSINAKGLNLKEIIVENIYLDFFGFSRGAACARYSCKVFIEGDKVLVRKLILIPDIEVMLPLKQDLELKMQYDPKVKITFGNVKIKNVGIFDTVASHGLLGTALQISDTDTLSLNSITNAEKVVHITALDEFRKNFALTNSNSAGVSFSFPGAHSDIGGGYEAEESESYKTIFDNLSFEESKPIAFWFKNNGWVKKVLFKTGKHRVIELSNQSDLEPESFMDMSIEDDYSIILERKQVLDSSNPYRYSVVLNRSKIFNDFSKIPLNRMLISFKGAGLIFKRDKVDVAINPKEDIYRLKSAIYDQKTIREFRLKFMHFSAASDIVNASRETGFLDKYWHGITDPFKRKIHDG